MSVQLPAKPAPGSLAHSIGIQVKVTLCVCVRVRMCVITDVCQMRCKYIAPRLERAFPCYVLRMHAHVHSCSSTAVKTSG